MCYIIQIIPIIELIVTTCGYGGAVDKLGAYFNFLRMFADKKPYFSFLSVNISQLLKVSCSPTMMVPPRIANSYGL
jgi:hypothetical protein